MQSAVSRWSLIAYWEPKWVRKLFRVGATEIETCVDETTGLIVCPLCVNIDELCPAKSDYAGSRTRERYIDESVQTFFTVEDLVQHMINHSRIESAKRSRLEEEEEIEIEIEEEQEEE